MKNETEIYQNRSTLKYNIMKLYVLIPLFTSIIVFHNMKRKEPLFDSIMAIEPYSNYSKINTLQLQNEQQRDEFTRLNDDYTKLKEYLFRQDLYKKSLIN
jgi:hypothetical protein